jgi:hypothetical protein
VHEPNLNLVDPSAAIDGTTMPVGLEKEVLFADGSWDLLVVRCQAADRCGG